MLAASRDQMLLSCIWRGVRRVTAEKQLKIAQKLGKKLGQKFVENLYVLRHSYIFMIRLEKN